MVTGRPKRAACPIIPPIGAKGKPLGVGQFKKLGCPVCFTAIVIRKALP
jgi:hypothetical protein